MILKTRNLRLLPWNSADRNLLHEFFARPEVRRFLLDDQVMPMEWIEGAIEESKKDFEESGVGMWKLLAPDTHELYGVAGFRHFFEPPQLQVIYALQSEAWGRGLATEAARAMLQVGFERAQLPQVVGATDPPNEASVRVMQRCRMEGVDPASFDPPRIETGDTLFLSIRREAWQRDGERVLL